MNGLSAHNKHLLLATLVALLCLSGLACKDKKNRELERLSSQQQSAVVKALSSDEAFKDLMNSLGKKVEDLAKVTDQQTKTLEQTMKDYQQDRQRFQGMFEGVADRLDQIDQTMGTLNTKYNDLSNRIYGNSPNEEVKRK